MPGTSLGKADCPHCGGVGFLRLDVPVGHEKFGRLESCVCRANEIAENPRQRLYEMSNLERLSHLTFANFNLSGNPKAEFVSPQEVASLREALDVSETFARTLSGWVLMEGSYGCGKTHLAAAIANECVQRGVPTLFITVPDLLDSLRFASRERAHRQEHHDRGAGHDRGASPFAEGPLFSHRSFDRGAPS